ncbi:MAG: hypothetical protein F4145_12590 [Boseongicola sp. SB0675_bin_26]|nr:hypothetical protein [Boseongicola sp. SB0675_bin_26]
MSRLNRLGAWELAPLVRSGDVKPSEVMAAHLDRIAAREPQIGTFQCLDADRAMARARTADDHPATGPLHGVPFVIKDIIDTAEMPTGWGFDPYSMRQPKANAVCVDAMVAAGAIPIGKTVTTECA